MTIMVRRGVTAVQARTRQRRPPVTVYRLSLHDRFDRRPPSRVHNITTSANE